MYRRLPTLNEAELTLLNSSRLFTALTPFVGGVLGGLLFIIFVAELVTSNLFPAFTIGTELGVMQKLLKVHPQTTADLAKLIVWCFIAGLSEKFVTDILGSLQQAVGGKEVRSAKTPPPDQPPP